MRLAPLALALSASLLLAACQRTDDAPPAAAAPSAPAAEPAPTSVSADPMDALLAGDWRAPENAARDVYRHPRETLAFFGVTPGLRLIEISPGGGWYAELLAPLMRSAGTYTGVLNNPGKASSERASEYYLKQNQALREKFAAHPDVYDRANLIEIDPAAPDLGTPGSADVVLTFRNVHNWVMAGQEAAMFQAFYAVLRPGGTLGVSEHRAAPGRTLGEVKESGYLPEDYVIGLATAAGFELVDRSEINANPLDTKDHPNGVWTLPPGNRHDDSERAKYQAIGESDRMTLKFVKPQDAAAPAADLTTGDAGAEEAAPPSD